MGEAGVSNVVVPSTFFWTPIVERLFVDGDSRWVLVFPLEVSVVSLDSNSCFPGFGVELAEFREIRHWIASSKVVIRIEMMTMI